MYQSFCLTLFLQPSGLFVFLLFDSLFILEMYKTCLANLHRNRRSGTESMEAKILNMLYQCGLFLRQSGLWEQLWTLLKMYLELNFQFHTNSHPPESLDKELLQLEEVILTSNLPSHELWLRIEKLREASHWLPWDKQEECEDPQRLVFNEDVSELIQPITYPGNMFRLCAITFTLLKVPLLPCRHTTMHQLGLDYVPWALDALELLLPTFYPLSTVNFNLNHLLTDVIMFTVGPQYLRSHPGQEEFLQFVMNIMKQCAENLTGNDQTGIYIWWFMFQRLLIIFNRKEIIKLGSKVKQIRSEMKNLLKKSENRNNLIFYREYALLEFELGNTESAFNILTTAIKTQPDAKTEICSLYRTLVELEIRSNKSPLANLIRLANGSSTEEAANNFMECTESLLRGDINDLTAVEQFLPNYLIDWLVCNAWFIYFTKSPLEAGGFLETIMEKYFKSGFYHEVLMEIYVGMLHKYCTENLGSGTYSLLNQTHTKAIKMYPNNLFFLATLAQIEVSKIHK